MVNLRENILKNQIAYYNGLIAKHQQNVEIYLNQPVGMGEHSDVMGTIDGEINAIAQAHEKIEMSPSYAGEEVIVQRLIDSGKFTKEEIESIINS